jgi:hypothetical protein
MLSVIWSWKPLGHHEEAYTHSPHQQKNEQGLQRSYHGCLQTPSKSQGHGVTNQIEKSFLTQSNFKIQTQRMNIRSFLAKKGMSCM